MVGTLCVLAAGASPTRKKSLVRTQVCPLQQKPSQIRDLKGLGAAARGAEDLLFWRLSDSLSDIDAETTALMAQRAMLT